MLLTLDTTRADALTSYGGPTNLTPHLDELARQSVRYTSAFTVTPMTQPSHTSMLTGLYPPRHTVRTNGTASVPAAARTTAEVAKESGYQTAAFLAAAVLDESLGLAQGFDHYDAPNEALEDTTSYAERPANEIVPRAVHWLEERDPTRPVFLWAHFFDPHSPYDPPPEFKDLGGDYRRNYLGEIAEVDRQADRLIGALKRLGLWDNTLFVVVADHGESLGEHQELSHSTYCYQATIRVPFLVRHPDGHRAGEVTDEIVSVADVHPTLVEAMGREPARGLDGMSLFRGRAPSDRGVYFESYYGYIAYGWSPLAGWVDDAGKYLHSSEPELYDWRTDPSESTNLIGREGERVALYQRAIGELFSKPVLEVDDTSRLAPELLEHIRSLGYAGAGALADDLPHPLTPTDLPAPATRAREQADVQRGMDLLENGLHAQAERILRKVVDANPRNYEAVDFLALALMRQRRQPEAIEPLQIALRSEPRRPRSWSYLGACLAVAQRWDEALEAFGRVLEMDPDHRQTLQLMAQSLEHLGRDDEAAPIRARYEELYGE